MLTITVPTPDPTRLDPSDPRAADAWLHKMGPTGWCVTQWVRDATVGLDPGDQLFVDLDDLRIHFGVKTSALHNALTRMSRFRVAYYDLALGLLVTDGTLPPATAASALTVSVHRAKVSA